MGGRGIVKFTVREANQGRIFKVGEPKIITIYPYHPSISCKYELSPFQTCQREGTGMPRARHRRRYRKPDLNTEVSERRACFRVPLLGRH